METQRREVVREGYGDHGVLVSMPPRPRRRSRIVATAREAWWVWTCASVGGGAVVAFSKGAWGTLSVLVAFGLGLSLGAANAQQERSPTRSNDGGLE